MHDLREIKKHKLKVKPTFLPFRKCILPFGHIKLVEGSFLAYL